MELDLNAARAAREIEERFKADLMRLPVHDRKAVLERVAVDVLTDDETVARTRRKAVGRGVRKPQPAPPPPPATVLVDDRRKRQWEEILTYCRSHPTETGIYHNDKVAQVLYPDKYRDNKNLTSSSVYTATRRHSPGQTKHASDVYFVLLGKARFRLATEADRTKIREPKP